MAAWLAFVAGPAVAAEPMPETKGEVVSHLRLDADRSGRLSAEIETTIVVPVDSSLRRRVLREATLGPPRYLGEARGILSSGLGLFEPGTVLPPPTLSRVEDGAIVTSSNAPFGDLAGSFIELSGFRLRLDERMLVRTVKPRPSGATWQVVLELDELGIESIEPPPAQLRREGSGTTVEWRFAAGEAKQVTVALDPPWAVSFNAAVSNGGWFSLRGFVGFLLSLAFLPLALVLLLRAAPGERPVPGLPKLLHQAVWLTVAAGFVLLAMLGVLIREQSYQGSWFELGDEWGPLLVDLFPVACLACAAGAVQLASASRASLPAIAKLTAAVVAAFLLLRLGGPLTPLSFELADLLRPPAFPLAILAWATLTYLLVDGLLWIALSWIGGGGEARRRRWTRLGSAALVMLLAGTSAIAFRDFDLYADAASVLVSLASNAGFVAADLLPVALLPGLAVVLTSSAGADPFLVRNRNLWLLVAIAYLFFVVTVEGVFVGFPSPWSLALGGAVVWALHRARRVRLEELDEQLRELNPDAGEAEGSSGSLLIDRRSELVDRALLIESVRRQRKAGHQALSKGEKGGEGYVRYRHRLGELDEAEAYLQSGDAPQGRTPSRADRERIRLRFPQRPPIVYPALGSGPGRDWRENGRVALRYGAVLALLPIAYVLYVIVRHDVGSVFDPLYGLELLAVLSLLFRELVLWLVAAFAFGCLFSWLPLGNGVLKGFLLSLPVVAGLGLMHLCPLYSGSTDWWFRCVEVLAFLCVLGLLVDLRTVRQVGLHWRDLLDLYQVRSVRFGLVNLAPLLLAAFGIYQQIRAGDPQGAVESALRSAPGQFPGAE